MQVVTRKDDAVWEDCDYKYCLKKSDAANYEDSMQVQKGTYDIYVSDGNKVEDTGVDITIENADSCIAYIDYYTVSFTDENNNLLSNIEKQIVRKGQKAECPSNSGKEGYIFEGWYWNTSDGSPEKYDFTQEITQKTTLQGKWTQASQSTVYTANIYLQNLDGTYSDTPSITQEGIEAMIDSIVNASDHSQKGFEPDADKNQPVSVKAGGNTVANFYYKRNSYTLTWDYNGGTKNWQGSMQETVKYGQPIVAPTDVSFTGYDLVSWTKEDGQPMVSDEKMPAADMKVKAVWKAIEYSVTFDLNGGSFAQGQEPNDIYTIKDSYSYYGIPVREGYTFEGWIGDNGNTPQKYIWISAGTTGDKNYQAVWTATEYKIEYDLNGGNWGSLDPVTGYTIESDAVVLMTPQKEGYTFAGWTGSNGTEPQRNVTIAQGSIGDKKYVANWQATATPEQTATPVPTATATPEQTAMPDPTATPEGNADLLTVGNYKIRLGMTFAEVNQEMGNSRIDKGCSPQGNDSYLYNPGGDYSSLIEVQFRNDTVVEMSTFSRNFSYEGIVSSGDDIETLTKNGFSPDSKHNLYNKNGDKEYINAVVDEMREKKVYGVRIFSSSVSLNKLLEPDQNYLQYNDGVNTYQGRLEAHYLNAYRSYHECELMTITNEGVAQKQSEYMAEKKRDTKTDARNWDWKKRFEVDYGGNDPDEYDENPKKNKMLYRDLEYVTVNTPDAFSAVTYAIAEQSQSKETEKKTFYDFSLGNDDDFVGYDMFVECGFADGYVAFDFYTFLPD